MNTSSLKHPENPRWYDQSMPARKHCTGKTDSEMNTGVTKVKTSISNIWSVIEVDRPWMKITRNFISTLHMAVSVLGKGIV